MKSLLIDIETIIHKSKPFCFRPNVVYALCEYAQAGFKISLFELRSNKKKLGIAIKNWIKDFLSLEDIPLTLITESKGIQSVLSKQKKATDTIILLSTSSDLKSLKEFTFLNLKSKNKSSLSIYLLEEDNKVYKSNFYLPNTKIFNMKSWKSFSALLHPPTRAFRVVKLERKTSETAIKLRLNLDGTGNANLKTGLHFFDHMLTNFTKHSGVDLTLKVKGDLEIDEHHTIEDTAIVLGQAFKKALGDKKGISRYGFVLPMDESEVACSIDFSGRSYLVWKQIPFKREYVGDFPTELLKHFYQSFAVAAELNINIKITGENEHHMIEASFKSLAKCIKQAIAVTGSEIPSTKGSLGSI